VAIVGCSCSSQRCGEEGEDPPGDEDMLTSPCALKWLCANAVGPAADFLCAGRKIQRKQINQINLPHTHVSSLACHEAY